MNGAPRVVSEVGADVERVDSPRFKSVDEQRPLVTGHDLRSCLWIDDLCVDTGLRFLECLHSVVLDLHNTDRRQLSEGIFDLDIRIRIPSRDDFVNVYTIAYREHVYMQHP